jgi:putative tricarboxylic transport membrane protein
MNKHRLFAGAALLLATLSPAAAQYKPTRPVEFVVHNGPGSGNDVFARRLIQVIEQEKLMPVRMQVANKVGGGSTTASSYMTEKAGDPNVIAVFVNIWLVDPLVQAEAKTKLLDMTPIALVQIEPALVVTRNDSPYKTLGDFISAAKQKPGQLKQSGGSITSRENVVRQLLMNHTGARWSFISFPGGGERLAALLGGHVDLMILDPSEAREQVRSGKLRVLAQAAEKRLPDFQDVPTLKEAGFDVPDVPQIRGVVGAPGMPADAVAFYAELFRKTTRTAAWQHYLADNQFQDAFMSPEDTRKFLGEFDGRLRGLLTAAGVKVVR